MTKRNLAETAKLDARAEKTRARILAYADQVFFARGFRKVTVEELCVGMALSKRTFYHHFQGRDELVEALVTQRIAEFAPQVLKNLKSRQPIQRVLENHFDLVTALFRTRVSTQMMADVQTLMPELWARIDSARRMVIAKLIELIEAGQKRGEINSELDAEVLGLMFQELIALFASPEFLLAHGLSAGQIASTVRVLFLHGILDLKRKESRG